LNPHVTILDAGSSGALKQADVFDDVEPRFLQASPTPSCGSRW